MSMLSSQIDRLRTAAQTYRNMGNHSAEGMLLDAADTIWELRDDLQRANAENVRLREENDCVGMAAYELGRKSMADENAKLREQVASFIELSQDMVIYAGQNMKRHFAKRLRKLGVPL